MLVTIEVSERTEAGWLVDIAIADEVTIEQRAMVAIRQTFGLVDVWLPQPVAGADLKVVNGQLGRIRSRTINDGDVCAIGTYLFDALIGRTAWSAIHDRAKEADLVELRVLLPTGETDLHDLHWEMMYCAESKRYIAEMTSPIVAVTRAVQSNVTPSVVRGLPRVLYAIGSSLDDDVIRPGLEIMGVLRRSSAERGMTTSVLQGASVEGLRRRVASFKPDVVHLICHGTPEYLEMVVEDDATGGGTHREHVDARRLAWALTPDLASPPSAAVLSACDSASGPRHVPSLAAQLVEHGIPVVLGVGGKISDQGCRLFMRKFSDALLEGVPLVRALATGRTAALLGAGNDGYAARHLDWALPTVLLSSAITGADFAVIDPAEVERLMSPMRHFKMSRLKTPPVFCGRAEFLDRFDELVDPNHDLRGLGAASKSPVKGIGDKRLLDELTARAIRERHIPCRLVEWALGDPMPTTAAQLSAHLMRSAFETLDAFRGTQDRDEIVESGAVGSLLEETGCDPLPPLATRRDVNRALNDLIRSDPCDRGNQDNLRDIVADAFVELRKSLIGGCEQLDESSQVVVLISEVQDMDAAAQTLFAWMEHESGLGFPQLPVSIAFSCSTSRDVTSHLQPMLESAHAAHGVHVIKLEAFAGTEESMAYEWVLMHPFGIDERSSLCYSAVDAGDSADWKKEFSDSFAGLPAKLTDPMFHRLAWLMSDRVMRDNNHSFVVGDDNLWMQQFAGKVP